MKNQATDKQVRFALFLMEKKGYGVRWMNSEHKVFGATQRERKGSVESFLASRTIGEISSIIDQLKAMPDA